MVVRVLSDKSWSDSSSSNWRGNDSSSGNWSQLRSQNGSGEHYSVMDCRLDVKLGGNLRVDKCLIVPKDTCLYRAITRGSKVLGLNGGLGEFGRLDIEIAVFLKEKSKDGRFK